MRWPERDYECAAIGHSYGRASAAGEIEFGAPVCGITMLDGRPLPGGRPALRSVGVQGLAVPWRKAHMWKGNFEVFSAGSLLRRADGVVDLLVEHDSSKKLASTQDGTLEIAEAEEGLVFRAALPDSPLGRAIQRDLRARGFLGVSPAYTLLDSEMRTIAGEEVKVIRAAALLEISLVQRPAIQETFAVPLDLDEAPPLAEEASTKAWLLEGASERFSASLRRLRDTLAALG